MLRYVTQSGVTQLAAMRCKACLNNSELNMCVSSICKPSNTVTAIDVCSSPYRSYRIYIQVMYTGHYHNHG